MRLPWTMLLATASVALTRQIDPVNAVGMSLSFDYGVLTIYNANGSAANVAKIEGGSLYREMMRSPDAMLWNPNKSQGTFTQQSYRAQAFRDWLPSWPGRGDNHAKPLEGMMKALKTAAESYLESDVSTAEVTFPFASSEAHIEKLRSAAASLNLALPKSSLPSAGIMAAYAHGLYGECEYLAGTRAEEPSAQLILAIDFTRAALGLTLMHEECGVFEEMRYHQNTSLGSSSLSDSFQQTRPAIVQALRNVTKLPYKHGNGAGIVRISELVLLGESATDVRLQDAIREVLEENYGSSSAVPRTRAVDGIDPLFVASQGVAMDCLDRQRSAQSHREELR